MTPIEYLDATKIALGIESDYELAKRLEVDRRRISAYRNGTQWPDTFIAAKMAISLQIDPAQVIADLESQHEKNAARREFWKGFISRAAITMALVCTLALSFSGTYENEAALAGGIATSIFAIFWASKRRIISDYDYISLSHGAMR